MFPLVVDFDIFEDSVNKLAKLVVIQTIKYYN